MRRTAALGALLAVAATLAAAQSPSPAERASESERALTDQETARLAEACRIVPEPTGRTVDLAGRQGLPVVRLPAMRFVRLLEYRATAGGERLSEYPPLPFGGIGRRDICRAVELAHLAPPEGGEGAIAALALHLRPGLDLPADYPTTGAEIVRRRQITDLPAGLYAIVETLADDDAVDLAALIRERPAPLDAGRPAIVLGASPMLLPVERAAAD